MNIHPTKLPEQFLEPTTCLVCQNNDYKILQKENYPEKVTRADFLKTYCSSSEQKLMDRLVQCNICGFVYLTPRVNAKVILESYTNAADSQFIEQNPERIRTFKRNFKKITARFPIKKNHPLKILDIGCAGGAFPEAVSQLGHSVIGIEPSSWLCDRGREMYGLDLRPGRLQDHHFKDNTFDYVTLWDVIEHLTQPDLEISEIKRILSHDGFLIINFPDYNSLARRVFGQKWPFFLSVHLSYFTPKTMTRFLQKFGFKIVTTKPFWQTLPLSYVLQRAQAYFPFISYFADFIKKTKLKNLPFTYNMGQRLIVAQKIQ